MNKQEENRLRRQVHGLMKGAELPAWFAQWKPAVINEAGCFHLCALAKDGTEIEIDVWRNETGWQAQAMRDGWDAAEYAPVNGSIGNGWGQTAEEAFAECLGSVEVTR